MKFNKCLILFLSIVCLSGCKMNKQLFTNTLTRATTHKLIEQVLLHQPTFEKLQASKVTATLTLGERKMSVSGSLNIITDSAIVVSIQPMFGIELFRLEADKHNVIIVDKMNRRYVKMSYREIINTIGISIDFSTLQALCSNQLFAVDNPAYFQSKDVAVDQQKMDETLQLLFIENAVNHSFFVSEKTKFIERTRLSVPGQTACLSVSYTNRQYINQVDFPTTIVFMLEDTNMPMQCSLDFLRLTLNDKANVAATNISKYQQVDITQLIGK